MLQEPITSGTVKMQAIWYNNFIKIRNKPIKKMFGFELFIGDLFQGKQLYEWNVFKEKYKLKNKDFFKWRQIIDAIPKKWKKLIRTDNIVEKFENGWLCFILHEKKKNNMDLSPDLSIS